MATPVKITLSGFVKRTLNTEALKGAIKSTGATLTRKGRSRNWLLQADNEQIRQINKMIHQSGENSWLWLTKKLGEDRTQLNPDELRNLVKQNPAMTVTQLMSLTDCRLSDARRVLDEIEWE